MKRPQGSQDRDARPPPPVASPRKPPQNGGRETRWRPNVSVGGGSVETGRAAGLTMAPGRRGGEKRRGEERRGGGARGGPGGFLASSAPPRRRLRLAAARLARPERNCGPAPPWPFRFKAPPEEEGDTSGLEPRSLPGKRVSPPSFPPFGRPSEEWRSGAWGGGGGGEAWLPWKREACSFPSSQAQRTPTIVLFFKINQSIIIVHWSRRE